MVAITLANGRSQDDHPPLVPGLVPEQIKPGRSAPVDNPPPRLEHGPPDWIADLAAGIELSEFNRVVIGIKHKHQLTEERQGDLTYARSPADG